MIPKCSLIIYICINDFDYNAIIVYFTVLKPGTLYETWYYPSYSYARKVQNIKLHTAADEIPSHKNGQYKE